MLATFRWVGDVCPLRAGGFICAARVGGAGSVNSWRAADRCCDMFYIQSTQTSNLPCICLQVVIVWDVRVSMFLPAPPAPAQSVL